MQKLLAKQILSLQTTAPGSVSSVFSRFLWCLLPFFSTLLFSSQAWFFLHTGLVRNNQPGPVTWAFLGLPSLHICTASPSLARSSLQCLYSLSRPISLFPVSSVFPFLSPMFFWFTPASPHPLISLVCIWVPSFCFSHPVQFLRSCCWVSLFLLSCLPFPCVSLHSLKPHLLPLQPAVWCIWAHLLASPSQK